MKLKVLLSAYQCGAGMGSVSQIGWEWCVRLAQRVDLTLVTHIRNQPAIEAQRAQLGGAEVVYINTEWFAGPLYRLAARLFPRSEHAVFLLSSLDYPLFDWQAVRLLKARQRAGEHWDVIHAVTPVSPVVPTSLHRLGAPLVLGPLNGGIGQPPAFAEIMRTDAAWIYPVRRLGVWLQRLIGSTDEAAVILAATQATRASLRAGTDARFVSMCENGVDLDLFKATEWPAPPSAEHPLHILFTGRLVPFKGLPMLLRAVAAVAPEFPVRLTVAGAGPLATEWRQTAHALGLADRVEFLGNLPLPQIAQQMQQAHVFCLPSVRESGGAVLLEAMAAARPVIALAFGGPLEIVDDEVGRLLAPTGEAEVVAALANTFREIVEHPEPWRARGLAGRRKVETTYSWDAKISAALQIYERIGGSLAKSGKVSEGLEKSATDDLASLPNFSRLS